MLCTSGGVAAGQLKKNARVDKASEPVTELGIEPRALDPWFPGPFELPSKERGSLCRVL